MVSRKTEIIFADFETTDFKDNIDYESIDYLDFKLFCSVKLNDNLDSIEKEYSFWNMNDVIEYFFENTTKVKKIIYFHNLSFDSKIFLRYIYDLDKYDISVIKTGSKILQIKVQKKTLKHQIVIEFKDSLCLLLKSIKDLGKMLRKNKLEFDFDYLNHKDLAVEYCLQDCRIIFWSYLEIIKFAKLRYDLDYDITSIPLTIASFSKKVLESLYPNAFQKHCKYLERYLRPYYFGGRVEVFDFVKENCKCFDVNSEYPFVMSKFLFANSEVLRVNCKHNDYLLNDFLNDKEALAIECIVREKNLDIPYFPTRIMKNKQPSVIYGLGFKKVFATKYDFEFFKKENMLNINIELAEIKAVYYCKEHTTFENFINPTYDYRMTLSSEHIFNYFCKIFLNSGYGKFGQKPEREQITLINDLENLGKLRKQNIEVLENDDTLISKRSYVQEYQTDNLLNACLITSYGRLTLYSYIRDFQKRGYKIKYVDTDSITVKEMNNDFEKSMENERKLGYLKLEGKYKDFQAIDSKEYHFYQDYEFDVIPETFVLILKPFKIKHKGINIKRIEQIYDLLNYYNNGIFNTIIPSIFYCFNRNKKFNATFSIKKQKRSYYTKRIINKDLTTNPITLQHQNLKYEKNNEKIIKKIIDKLGFN